MMAALLIGPAEREKIAELRAVAAARQFDPKRVLAAEVDSVRDMMNLLSIELPVGFHVTYSHEMQPVGRCHHISISVDRDNMLPATEAVEMILQEFGMRPVSESNAVWVEDVSPTLRAVNLVQVIA